MDSIKHKKNRKKQDTKEYKPLSERGIQGFNQPQSWDKDFLLFLNLPKLDGRTCNLLPVSFVIIFVHKWLKLQECTTLSSFPKNFLKLFEVEIREFKFDSDIKLLSLEFLKLIKAKMRERNGFNPGEMKFYLTYRDQILEPINRLCYDIQERIKNNEVPEIRDLRHRWIKLELPEIVPWGFLSKDNFCKFPKEVRTEIMYYLLCAKEIGLHRDLNFMAAEFIATYRY